MYAFIQNNEVIEYPYSIISFRKNNPNISLPESPTESQLNEVGIYSVTSFQKPVEQEGKVVEEGKPIFNGSVWVQSWIERDATDYELAIMDANKRSQAKVNRQLAVDAIVVTTSSGKMFDGDETSQTRMTRAILGLKATNTPSISWVLADNTVTDATVEELSEALTLAGIEQARIWISSRQ